MKMKGKQVKGLVHSALNHAKLSERNSLQWGGQRLYTALLLAMGQDAGVVEGLPELIWSFDHYLLLLFHVGTNNTCRGNLDDIKSDYRALWAGRQGHGDPRGALLSPAGEGKGCEEGANRISQ